MFREKLVNISESQEIKASAKSINQTQRNQLASELTNALFETFTKVYGCESLKGISNLNDYISFGMIDNKTIEFAIDNEKVGIIPIRISIAFPNFDTDLDLYSRVDDYQELIKEKELKAKQQAEIKKAKIQADNERREKMRALRESSTEK